ncbi:DUF402 domain-containing protein [Nocardioides dongxiaopingii]|nr:DUF402 domain-containing protein [Nocardioides sp. S-1144]
MPLHPGDAVRVEMTKWVDRPHWAFDAQHLGSDAHGDWIGIPAGTTMARPGATFVSSTDQVVLVPPDAGWVATFHAPGYRVTTYVDITTVPRWDGAVLRAVDLDLDVVRTAEGVTFVDDEDEFAEHQLTHAYPAEVVTAAEESCAWVLAQVRREHPPFDGACADRWLDRLAGRAGC